MVRTGPSPAKVRANGTLTSDPTPLTLADLRKQRRGSPAWCVLQLLFWAQWGSYPNLPTAYDPRVLARVGTASFTGAYAAIRPQLAASRPDILDVQQSPRGALVTLRFLTATGPPTRDSFLLRLRRGRWVVVFDTLLERALSTWAQSRIDTLTRQPSARAIRAGSRLSERYRDASIP